MYFDFDFNRDADFLKNSPSFQLMSEKINSDDNRISDIDKKIVNASLKLWAECVIKNNLDINSSVDPSYLLSEQNSQEVFDILGNILWKQKDKRTTKEFRVLRSQDRVNSVIQLNVIYLDEDNIDICNDLKKEFKTWKLAQELNQEIPLNDTKFKSKKV
jgi:hypothetical protein